VTELLKNIAVVASFLGMLYAPFHYLDKFASSKARARLKYAIKTDIGALPADPLSTLFERLFGPKHLSFRCLLLSAVFTFVVTFLALVFVNQFIYPISSYLADYSARAAAADKLLKEAMRGLLPILDFLLKAVQDATDQQSVDMANQLRQQRKNTEQLLQQSVSAGSPLLLWMLLSVAASVNVACDYVALAKTRAILKRVCRARSGATVGALLLVDILCALVIWVVGIAIFCVVNLDEVLKWTKETPPLIEAVALVSLSTTLAASIWLYTFLIGRVIASALFKSIGAFSDPEEHAFKVVGIAGSISILAILALSWAAVQALN